MKILLSSTVLVALLVSFVCVPLTNADNGLHTGNVNGCGHSSDCTGKGHDKHGCDAECPLCGGNPCILPCPGKGGGAGGYFCPGGIGDADEHLLSINIDDLILSILYDLANDLGIVSEVSANAPLGE